MKLRKTVWYSMDHTGKWLSGASFFAGAALFLIVVYYYVFGKIEDVSSLDLAFHVVLPLVLWGAYVLLLKGVRLNVPFVYACIAAVVCLVTIVSGFGSDELWVDILGIVWYILCLVALFVSVLGYFHGKWYAMAGFFAAAVARFFLRDLMGYFEHLELVAAMPDLAALSGILSLGCLCGGLEKKQRRSRGK